MPSRRSSHKESLDRDNEQATADTKGVLAGAPSPNRLPQQTVEGIVSMWAKGDGREQENDSTLVASSN